MFMSFIKLTSCLAVDALIVGAETLSNYLRTKRTWTGKIVLLTDGESPIQIEKWESIAKKLNSFNFRITIMYVSYTFPASTPDHS
jgi:ATP-dependent DNA helicase 2 subunit 2